MDKINSMDNPLAARVVGDFGLTPEQRRAAAQRGRDVVVTAGAGSGKTRTLTARYISLLAEGLSPRRVAAITFTEKAAREMRSRVRSSLLQQMNKALTPEERQRWGELDAQMDAARIGTIHSLCAEILRTHPAEAGIDPRFDVVDEGLAATLRAQAVRDILAWLAGDPTFLPVFNGIKTITLEKLLLFLLNHRLEARAAFDQMVDIPATILQALQHDLSRPALQVPIEALRSLRISGELAIDAGDALAGQVEELLVHWDQAARMADAGDWLGAVSCLINARHQMGGRAGKKNSQAKTWVAQVREAYTTFLNPWLGGAKGEDQPPDERVENLFVQVYPLLRQAFDHLVQAYLSALRQRQALDFDDLEAGAAGLLAEPAVRRRWQAELDALLVDEFQDTNARQREIILALRGELPGRMFVVGDARQSIYRFRRADVTVFRRLEEENKRRGGLSVDLQRTYRAHEPLLLATGDLLEAVMGSQEDPERPYLVPFTALHSDHDTPRPGMQAPHVEFVLGAGADTDSARPAAAQALAQRLRELHREGQIKRWDDVALLLRASTGFQAYEAAFEAAGIPFVTVAGRGFYDRPEIRDVLNLLRALADPWDDLAMAGLLRSPAFSLSDAALYHLRWRDGRKQSYWTALQGDLEALEALDQAHARRALGLLRSLQPLVGRLPVAELLKRLVDGVDYRAILASAELERPAAAAGRLWRNLDKLLTDAQASQMVSVSDFLEYLDALRDVDAREGEAPAEADGAVRLMTIHKAKGLEFPLVVLADAARDPGNGNEPAYLAPELGVAFRLDRHDVSPLFFRLAHYLDKQQADAEEKRLLYVALTRAQEKLLINGHCTGAAAGKWSAKGWLGGLTEAAGIDLAAVIESDVPLVLSTRNGHALRAWALPAAATAAEVTPRPANIWPESQQAPLYRPLSIPEIEQAEPEPDEARRPWRATGEHRLPPADALGRLVHRALQCWMFPTGAAPGKLPALAEILEAAALEAGLADPGQRAEALRLCELLLERLRRHPLWQEINQSSQRYHEVPYAQMVANRRLDSGYIDLLYKSPEGDLPAWQIVDFKSDSLRSEVERQAAVDQYRPQMLRYAQAGRELLHEPVRVRLCFLDDDGKISLQEM